MSDRFVSDSEVVGYALGRGGPLLLNLRLDSPSVCLMISEPGMAVTKMVLVTSLALGDGMSFQALKNFAQELEIIALCGHSDAVPVEIKVSPGYYQATLEFGVGPTGMYQSAVFIRTKSGETLEALIGRTLMQRGAESHLVGLMAVTGTGHQQPDHHHPGHHENTEHQPSAAQGAILSGQGELNAERGHDGPGYWRSSQGYAGGDIDLAATGHHHG